MLEEQALARSGRPSLSYEQEAVLWRRWNAGETLSDIGRARGTRVASVLSRRRAR